MFGYIYIILNLSIAIATASTVTAFYETKFRFLYKINFNTLINIVIFKI